MTTAGLLACSPGSLLFRNCRPPISSRESGKTKFQFLKVSVTPIRGSFRMCSPPITCTAVGRNGRQGLRSEGVFTPEPFWRTLIKDVVWSSRSLGVFLAEQPSQLKYIEWPTFQSTLKTATLTLVLVAMLIVALASIDSALCYMLALLLRRPA